MKLKEISVEEIIKAFETFKTRKEICDYFGTKTSQSRFIRSICNKADINPDDYIEPIKRHDKDEKTYCLCCGKEIIGRYRFVKKFCNSSCAATYNNTIRYKSIDKLKSFTEKKEVQHFCLNCGKQINYISGNMMKFCCNQCQQDYIYNQYITSWKNGEECGCSKNGQVSRYIRKYLFNKFDDKCELCGWGEINQYTGTTPLEVHHKDGNCFNNNEENLQLLCPNCHSLTETYKSKDKKGRKKRIKEIYNK